MKKSPLYLILLLLLSSFSQASAGELDFVLPDGVDYKIQKVKETELHLFRLAQHPIDADHWGPDLPMLILMKMEPADYAKAISDFEGETKEEIEKEFLAEIESQLSQPVHALTYSMIHLGEFRGHRIQIDTQAGAGEEIRKYTLLNSYIQNSETCWMANGMSLRGEGDVKTVDAILKSLRVGE